MSLASCCWQPHSPGRADPPGLPGLAGLSPGALASWLPVAAWYWVMTMAAIRARSLISSPRALAQVRTPTYC